MRTLLVAGLAIVLSGGGGGLAAQGDASGTFSPTGPPVHPPVRTDAGGACVVDLTQDYTVAGSLSGRFRITYRILVAGACGSPAGTFDEQWIAYGTFDGDQNGESTSGTLWYTARVRSGGSVDGRMVLRGGLEADLQISGAFADGKLSYEGTVESSKHGGR